MLFYWSVSSLQGFRQLSFTYKRELIKEIDKFNKWQGNVQTCIKCKISLPATTYFFMSGGKHGLHKYCKKCEKNSKYGWGRVQNNTFNLEGLHYCSKCDRTLPLNDLYFSRTSGRCNKTGYSSNCKECNGNEFKLHKLNDFTDFLGIKDAHKVCSKCLVEYPDNSVYFFNRNDRDNGSTICKKCLGYKHEIRRLNRVLKNFTPHGFRYCNPCKRLLPTHDFKHRGMCKECRKERNKEFNSRPENKEYKRFYVQKRRAKQKQLLNDLTEEQYLETLQFFEHSCVYCGVSEEDHLLINNTVLHQDHVIPLSKNGAYTKSNIVPACDSCNKSKKNRSLHNFYLSKENFTEAQYRNIIQFLECYIKVGDSIE
ncbi:HNH endonuclease [Brevibacillus porteri]|uniref:HNH endonuclease n=1 Tax=Brevibacillus porteri TaxID=2126350 RepID=UPI003644591D